MKHFCYIVCYIFVGSSIFVIGINDLAMSQFCLSDHLRDQRQFLKKTNCDRSFYKESTIIDDECACFEKNEPLIGSIANVAMRQIIIFKWDYG